MPISKNIEYTKYQKIHYWIRVNFGKATICENKECLKKSNCYQWALRKGFEYDYKRRNFIQMCRSCHAKLDSTELNGKKSGELQKAKTKCPNGHYYNKENTYLQKINNSVCRGCKICRYENYKKWKKKII